MGDVGASRPGLRERKKIRTAQAIRREALRLFEVQGYRATSLEQIAEAAEVSVTTLRRYFPAKELLVVTDRFDDVLLRALREQPPDLAPLTAVRSAVRTALADLTEDDVSEVRRRCDLLRGTPELRAGLLDVIAQAGPSLARLLAPRLGDEPDSLPVRAFVGSVIGAAIASAAYWIEHPGLDLVAALDEGLAGLPAHSSAENRCEPRRMK